MNVVARQATVEDVPRLARLQWRWRVEEWSKTSDLDAAAFEEFLTQWVADHRSTHQPFVVEVDGKIVGMAWLCLSERVPHPHTLYRPFGDVQSVYISPEVRGLGAGAVLMAALVQHAAGLKLRRLTVHAAESAIGFYEKLGFVHSEQWMELLLGSAVPSTPSASFTAGPASV